MYQPHALLYFQATVCLVFLAELIWLTSIHGPPPALRKFCQIPMKESRYAAGSVWPTLYYVSHTVHCQNHLCLLHSIAKKSYDCEDPFAVALVATQSWALQLPAEAVQAISSQICQTPGL